MNPRLMAILVVSVTVAVVVLAITSTYNTVVSSTQHNDSCVRIGLVLDSIHDVILISVTPQPGQKFTAAQVKQITAFETSAFERLDKARC